MITIISLSPIIVSALVLVYALMKAFNKRSFIVSAAIAMVTEMMIMKISDTWYAFLFSIVVPMAVSYVVICLILSIKEKKEATGR